MTNSPDVTLALGLGYARGLACNLERALGEDLALGLGAGRALGLARKLERVLSEDLALALAPARALLAHALDITRDIAVPLEHATRLVRTDADIDIDICHILALASDLERALGRVTGPLGVDADALARDLETIPAGVSAVVSSGGQLRLPMPLAGRLTAIAARLLPGAEQARYGEEFGSELAEIALAGGGRRAQLAYAARTVLSSAWQLRAALRSPRRRGAVQ